MTWPFFRLCTACTLAAGLAFPQGAPLPERIAGRLRTNDLKADVSFLASDALEGRGTPSTGLQLAAEYIAAEFRRAGLEPAGDDGYFQTGTFIQATPAVEGLSFTFASAPVSKGSIGIQEAAAADVKDAQALKLSLDDVSSVEALTVEQVRGKVLMVDAGQPGPSSYQALRRLQSVVAGLQPALVVLVRRPGQASGRATRIPLRDATAPPPEIPVISVSDPAIFDAVTAAPPGPMKARVSAHIPPPRIETIKLRNVTGVIRGSDPTLKDTYLVITAHYDHLGISPNADGDRIFNGANDDASGTASLIEIAGALSALEEKPMRTIVFMAVFGEEVGSLGARWYTSHPAFPLAKTIADINLEQLGRTDDNEGPKPLQFNLTGFDYTDLAPVFVEAGAETGIRVLKHEKNSDAFFRSSDNAAFADAGIPSTTLSVSYLFPDYHRPGDKWPKLDYDNMAKVDVAVALGIWNLANNPQAPRWNRDNPKAARYLR
ncbi:MAG TPA: M28 family peptidase [Candidatus Acidoferrales bacterium]|nr:M28 family peptidase [Candidatus Acidoferrales bacterium]